ncbi:MAG: patatin-like phospholipase family protein [Syntrophus sp. (in: bacteria)]
MRKLITFLIFIMALSGCATYKNGDYKSYCASDLNWGALDTAESRFYQETKKHVDGKPQLGLALSGGGQRAASVSIGFLSALHETDILSQIDVISSVSGGSYAAYWWYSKNYWAAEKKENDILLASRGAPARLYRRYFDPGLCERIKDNGASSDKCQDDTLRRYQDYRFHYHNYNHGYLLNYAQEFALVRWPELVFKGASWVISIPFHWIASGLFDMKLNLNVFQDYYQHGISRDYGLYPICGKEGDCVPLKSYANAKYFRYAAIDPKPSELFKSIKNNNLPFWVINTTAAYSHGSWPKMFRADPYFGYSKSLANTVYEFTPAYQGSPRFGFSPYGQTAKGTTPLMEISRMVAISGAAIDSMDLTFNTVIDAVNLSLGQYIPNPQIEDSKRAIHRSLPIPFYWFHENRHDETSPFIYLSDGGHADNLGIYSLLRRGTKQVIVLDAEAEGDKKTNIAKFDALVQDRCLIMQERGLLIDLPDILDDELACEPKNEKRHSYNFKKAKTQAFKGVVCRAKEEAKHCEDKDVIADIYYIKLAVDYCQLKDCKQECLHGVEDSIDRYSCDTRWHAFNNKDDAFPHDPTRDINYSPTQYSGYVALGYDLGRLLNIKDGQISIK